ncbi:MAG: hypothetical protein H6Q10_2947 [Acidobacteria bacterium]|nr:hypothetical protein [Acidobacteriota bacterium]
MPTILIACRALAGELELASREAGVAHPTRWIEAAVHVRPDALRRRLQDELDGIAGAERVILGFGYCGHSLLGLRAGAFELVFPRADDCISLMLGSAERREAVASEAPTYFLTEGWLDNGVSIWDDYRRTVDAMGPRRAGEAFATMLAHYSRLGVIDTGACPLARLVERTQGIAETLGLEHRVIPGSTRFLQRLLAGPWEDEFVTVPPGGAVTLDHLLGLDRPS